MEKSKDVTEDLRFCPDCGYEGNDETCPVCRVKTESLNSEIDRIAKAEDKKDKSKDLIGEVSLEDEQIKEVGEPKEEEQDETL